MAKSDAIKLEYREKQIPAKEKYLGLTKDNYSTKSKQVQIEKKE
jgi:hypothetical protein